MGYTKLVLLDIRNRNKVGEINFYYDKEEESLTVSWLEVNDEYKGHGFGKLLFLFMVAELIYIQSHISTMELDDCSDYALTKKSIYYSLNFRVDPENIETMKIYFGDKAPIQDPYVYRNGNVSNSNNRFMNLHEYLKHLTLTPFFKNYNWNDFSEKYIIKKVVQNSNNIIDHTSTVLRVLSTLGIIEYNRRACRRFT